METSLIQYFHEADPSDFHAQYVWIDTPNSRSTAGPRLLKSHGWLDGTLCGQSLEEIREVYNQTDVSTWPLVQPICDICFCDRSGRQEPGQPKPVRVPLELIREIRSQPPALSLVLVRWGGVHRVPAGRREDWGKLGCPPCDTYMSAVISAGVKCHPQLEATFDFEVFSLFVSDSDDTRRISSVAAIIAGSMRGVKKASFWMLWPAEWDDFGTELYAGYVRRDAFFAAMRACELAGICSCFPHPADQYELITSKTWMATLASDCEVCLPLATLVSKEAVSTNALEAARDALRALADVRSHRGDSAALSTANKDCIQKGVVKCGWSWEAQFVFDFCGEERLACRMTEMFEAEGCSTSVCIVQEWVDFDFEMRLFFFVPRDWDSSVKLLPRRFEYNTWGEWDDEDGKPGYFSHVTRLLCLDRWQQDDKALRHAEEKAIDVSQYLIRWLCAHHPEPVPMVRLDFMAKRVSIGEARVVFGEFCEMGACCLTWEEGPPSVWRAALDYALR